ncbi:MAG: hypothetical protein EAX96_05660 [Candidatus Lokiarchaeota archaeon]|nr:hypothetical protein [Candidatus Lokiarchaeota archaeon]
MHDYNDIPDEVKVKQYVPLMPNIWQIFRELGWERTKQFIDECEEGVYDFFEERLNESIQTSKLVIEGKIKEPEKVLSYILAVPSLTIRSDIVHGTQKLLIGDSTDLTFIALDDFSQELFVFLNAHIEDGVPVDWWLVRPDDELLDRRHMKLGIKIREIPKKMKDFKKTSIRMLDVLRDIRNERTPQWSSADYFVISVWVSFALNVIFEPSNYESMDSTYQGWAAKEIYGLADYIFLLYPWPAMINMMFMQGKESFVRKIANLTTEDHLYFQPFEQNTLERVKTTHAEIFDIYKRNILNQGIPFPIQSIESGMPNIKNKSDPNTRFEKQYKSDNFIKVDAMQLNLEDVLKGVYCDITSETNPNDPIDPSKVLSTGIGSNTQFK